MTNSLLGFTPENFLKLEVFPSESSSPHRGTEITAIFYREEPAYISRKMYGPQHHAKVIPYKIIILSKKGKILIEQYQKKLFQPARNEAKERMYKVLQK